MRDNHLHTHFSYDSGEEFENYLISYDGEIVTTEHFDLSNPYHDFQDDVPDYEAYSKEIERLNQRYGNRLKKGIEIGYFEPREKDTLGYLSGKTFDLKLLSVHHNGRYDYLQRDKLPAKRSLQIAEYLDLLDYAIGRVDADVLAHFDYGFRTLDLTVEDLKIFERKLLLIFDKMVQYGLAFELNTKSMYLYQHEHLYRYALELLKDVGCKSYSLGSDGHVLEHFMLGFDRIEPLLIEFQLLKKLL